MYKDLLHQNPIMKNTDVTPGRLVRGILSCGPTEVAANVGSENQSFADMWVDFLLKETEEREKRESAGNNSTGKPTEGSHGSLNASVPPFSNQRLTSGTTSALSINSLPNHNPNPPRHGHFPRSEHLSSEFSIVPLSPSATIPSESDIKQVFSGGA